MKPRTEKTYVDQVLSNGKGVTWLDDCRIPFKDCSDKSGVMNGNDERSNFVGYTYGLKDYKDKRKRGHGNSEGRFPANLLVSDDILNDHSRYFDLDAWFAIIPKPAKSEKNKGCEDLPEKIANPNYGSGGFKRPTDEPERQIKPRGNHHPTVKPIKLMSYLITLGSRPDEIVLDPFMGSGTTGISAKLTGRNFIGYEMEEEYFQIAEARINAWETGATGQDKEGRSEDKKNGKKKSDGPRTGQTSITSY
jgi:site-specific DNA-methyltransferase (adenine-specific)